MTRIVVLAGEAGHGKDAAADIFVEHGFVRAPLAGPLKDMIRSVLRDRDYPAETIERFVNGDLKEVPHEAFGGNTCRVAMQKLGTEWGRALFGEKFWLDTWSIKHCQPDNYVVTDCRFENEADYLKSLGAELFLVRRPGFSKAASHASEDLEWAKARAWGHGERANPTSFDIENLWNDGTLADFTDMILARFFS